MKEKTGIYALYKECKPFWLSSNSDGQRKRHIDSERD
jgi:hypothetical protein